MKGLRFVNICSRPAEVLALTSLRLKAFLTLLTYFEAKFQEHMSKWRMDGEPRTSRRAFITYRNCPLPTPEDRLLFILSYLKTNALQVVHGRMFGMVQCKANTWIHVLLRVLHSTMDTLDHIPCRTLEDLARYLNFEEEEAAQIIESSNVEPTAVEPAPPIPCREDPQPDSTPPATGPVFCHDGMERRIQRPRDDKQQKLNYSGKKKGHMVKNVLLADQSQRIVFLSDTTAGKTHDKKIADATPYPLPAGSILLQDLGFQGFSLEGVQIIMPAKKPRGGELTLEQKESNREISRRRVSIEHVNSSVKRCRVIKDTLRLLKEGIRDFIMEVCCALHNFRIDLVPWQPMV